MERSAYNSLGLKMNRTIPGKRGGELFTLKDFLEHKFTIKTEEELKKVFVKDLIKVLLTEDLFELIQNFFELEADLNNACEHFEFGALAINFDEFYKNISPVLMRALLENVNHKGDAEMILKTIKEALRIGLEEELIQLEDIGNTQ